MKKIILGIMLLMSSLMFFGCNNNAASQVIYWAVNFNSNGGTAVTTITVTNDFTIPEPTAPTKDGFTFDGWYTDNSTFSTRWDFATNKVTADTTLYAKWTTAAATSWTVTFDNDGSTFSTKTATNGSTITAPTPDPTKDGFTFGGWYKESSCTNAWTFTTDTVTANITLYAKWTVITPPVTWTVIYDGNGGVYYGSSSAIQRTVDNNASAPVPGGASVPIPTRTGYAVDGWYTDSSYSTPWNFATDKVTSNITLYPKWIATLPTSVNLKVNTTTYTLYKVNDTMYDDGYNFSMTLFNSVWTITRYSDNVDCATSSTLIGTYTLELGVTGTYVVSLP